MISILWPTASAGVAAADRIFDAIDARPRIVNRPGAAPLVARGGAVSFRDVGFAYPKQPPTIERLNLVIRPGERVAAILPSNLAEFLRAQGFVPGTVVVEHNGEAVSPSEFGTRSVAPGDRLEIVRLVVGG